MQDLLLWRRLSESDVIDDQLCDLIRQAAQRNNEETWVYCWDLARRFDDLPESTKKDALLILGHAKGRLAVEKCVSALQSTDESVASTAIDQLIDPVREHIGHLTHCFFSPNVNAIGQSIQRVNSPLSAHLALYGLIHPKLRASILQKLSSTRLELYSLTTIQAFQQSEIISQSTALALVKQCGLEHLLTHIACSESIDLTQAELFLNDAFQRDQLTEFNFDLHPNLEWLIKLLSQDTQLEIADDHFSRSQASSLWPATLFHAAHRDLDWRRRLTFAHLCCLSKGTPLHPSVVTALGLLDIRLLGAQWLDRSTRQEMAKRIVQSRSLFKPSADEQLAAQELLMDTKLVKRPSGQLDMLMISALLSRISSPTQFFQSQFKIGQLVAAFNELPEESMAIFSTELSSAFRQELIREICHHRRSFDNRLFAKLAITLNVNDIDVLDLISHRDLLAVASEIQQQLASGAKISERRQVNLGSYFGSRLATELSPFIESVDKLNSWSASYFLRELLCSGARKFAADLIVPIICQLPDDSLARMLDLIQLSSGIPYALTTLLIENLSSSTREIEAVKNWLAQYDKVSTTTARQTSTIAPEIHSPMSSLHQSAADRIASCTDTELASTIVAALSRPVSGFVDALKRRSAPTHSAEAVVGLAICGDPLDQVDELLSSFGGNDPTTIATAEEILVSRWNNSTVISALGHAVLWRWEFHLFQFGDQFNTTAKLCDWLRAGHQLNSRLARVSVWSIVARLLKVLRARERAKFVSLIQVDLLTLCVEKLTGPEADQAALILMAVFSLDETAILLESVKNQATALLPSMTPETRQAINSWINSQGMATQSKIRRSVQSPCPVATKVQIDLCRDLVQLRLWCQDAHSGIVTEAALRLSLLERIGAEVLTDLLLTQPPAPHYSLLADTIPLWPDDCEDLLVSLREHCLKGECNNFHRFILATNLLERGEGSLKSLVIELINQLDDQGSWFSAEDWQRLTSRGFDTWELAKQVSGSPQAHAYTKAVELLLSKTKRDDSHASAIETFLECGTSRLRSLRERAALWLWHHGDQRGMPIIASAISSASWLPDSSSLSKLLRIGGSILLNADIDLCRQWIRYVTSNTLLSDVQKSQLLEQIVAQSYQVPLIEQAVGLLSARAGSKTLISSVARTFKWGIDTAFELLHQVFSISMLANREMGYTRLKENRVFVNILPMLTEQQHGRGIVRGLILHELGHHIYHKGPGAEAIWQQAEKEKLHQLLNLVSDEHLERNLRSRDSEWDAWIKQLGAYAFQHARRETSIFQLLESLGIRSLEILQACRLGVADDADSVRVENGWLLKELERSGSSFARFFRALRMGLGNRWQDPKVEQALELFRNDFRQADMGRLYEIAVKLREIFQDESEVYRAFLFDEAMCPTACENARSGRGIDDHAIQREIRRITSREELESMRQTDGGSGGGGTRAINVIEDIEFNPIQSIQRIPFDPRAWAMLSQSVANPARLLSQFLSDLGFRYQPQRRRLAGYRLDRQALTQAIVRKDPRVMISRIREVQNDLFVGMAIDCSGSMSYSDNIELAKRFGALMATAIGKCDSIDLRIIGFTDKVIYDAGNAERPAIAGLSAGGGNNDAAALWHLAQLALESRRRSKLLVMISDGLPTECSVIALKTLVDRLTKKLGMCCAQIAVEPLEEICFPHYVLVKEADERTAIRKFGQTVAKLIRTSLR